MSAELVVEHFVAERRDSLRGVARVRLRSGMVLHDVAIHEKNGIAWASAASKPILTRDGNVLRDSTGNTQNAPIISFASRALRDRFSEQVIAALRDRYPDALT